MADWELDRRATAPTVIDVAKLMVGLSPRQTALQGDHVAVLSEALDELPPILVHGETMTVIDGVHRLEAIRRAGRTRIRAEVVQCSDAEALVLAVASNVRHGLPLTRAERRRAAEKILDVFPERSDRWIGSMTGLSHKTIGGIRRGHGETQEGSPRLGRDGRRRPLAPTVTPAEVRRAAGASPLSSTRALAREFGVSASTVHRALHPEIDGDPDETPESAIGPSPLLRPIHRLLDDLSPEADAATAAKSIPLGLVYDAADACRERARRWLDLAAALEVRACGTCQCR